MLKMIKLNLPFQNLMYKYCLSPIYIFNKIEIFIKFGAKPRILRILIFICLHSEKYHAILRPINHRPKIHVQYSWLDNVRILKMSGVLWKNIQSFMGKQNCFPFSSMWWVPIEWFGCQIILVLGQRTSFLICPFALSKKYVQLNWSQNETHFGLFRWKLRFHGSQQLGLGLFRCKVNYPKWLFSPHVDGDIFWCILRTWLLTARHCMCKMHLVDKVRSTRCWKDDGDPCGYVVGFYHHTVSSIPYILRLWIRPIITL